jgi:hypothetical protein
MVKIPQRPHATNGDGEGGQIPRKFRHGIQARIVMTERIALGHHCGMSYRVVAALALVAATAQIGCGNSDHSDRCWGGCLCYRTPDTCPAGCFPAHERLTDGGVGPFFCSNGPPVDIDAGATDANTE